MRILIIRLLSIYFFSLTLSSPAFGSVIFTTEDPFLGTEGETFTIDRENISSGSISLEFGTTLSASLDFDTILERFVFSHDIALNGNEIIDSAGNLGLNGQVLTSDGTGQNIWQTPASSSGPFSFGLVQSNGSDLGSQNVTTINKPGTGQYSVLFTSPAATTNYVVQLTVASSAGRDDYHIAYANRGFGGFDVIITEQDNGTTAGTYRDSEFSFLVIVP